MRISSPPSIFSSFFSTLVTLIFEKVEGCKGGKGGNGSQGRREEKADRSRVDKKYERKWVKESEEEGILDKCRVKGRKISHGK